MGAARMGKTETVEALLAKGADINAKKKNGETALMLAESAGHTEIVRILKQAGVGYKRRQPENVY
jgi:ankyrin repeat protein